MYTPWLLMLTKFWVSFSKEKKGALSPAKQRGMYNHKCNEHLFIVSWVLDSYLFIIWMGDAFAQGTSNRGCALRAMCGMNIGHVGGLPSGGVGVGPEIIFSGWINRACLMDLLKSTARNKYSFISLFLNKVAVVSILGLSKAVLYLLYFPSTSC